MCILRNGRQCEKTVKHYRTIMQIHERCNSFFFFFRRYLSILYILCIHIYIYIKMCVHCIEYIVTSIDFNISFGISIVESEEKMREHFLSLSSS